MGRRGSYGFEKRQKEIRRKKKKEEKAEKLRRRKEEATQREAGPEGASSDGEAGDPVADPDQASGPSDERPA